MQSIKTFFSEYEEKQKTCSDQELEAWLLAECEAARAGAPGDQRMLSSMFNELGSFYRHRGMHEKGEEAFLQAKELWGDEEKDANYATIINNMAGNYRLMGKFSEAIALFQEASALYQKFPETPKSLVSSANNNLALVYLDTGNYPEAAKMLQAACDILKDSPEFDHEKATAYANMAFAYYKNGDADTAAGKAEIADELYQRSGLKDTAEYHAFLKLKELISK